MRKKILAGGGRPGRWFRHLGRGDRFSLEPDGLIIATDGILPMLRR